MFNVLLLSQLHDRQTSLRETLAGLRGIKVMERAAEHELRRINLAVLVEMLLQHRQLIRIIRRKKRKLPRQPRPLF